MNRLALLAPLSGWALPLAQVPDPVFAQGMAGEGLAIDPVDGVLCAPCGGVVVLSGAARHAVSVRHASGLEVLMHVGIDTVALRGEGFELLVEHGQAVGAGDELLRFDLDRIARGAKSAVTPVLVVGGGAVEHCFTGGMVKAGDVIMEVEAGGSTGSPRTFTKGKAPGSVPDAVHAAFVVPFDHGLHARPAARIVAALRGTECDIAFHAHGRQANARSVVAMMGLGVQAGDRVDAVARGADAVAALDALRELLVPVDEATATARSSEAPTAVAPMPAHLEGIVASPGLAIGVSVALREAEIAITELGHGEAAEGIALATARDRLGAHLQVHAAHNDVLAAHAVLLADPELDALADAALREGKSAAFAWRHATRRFAAQLAALGDERMRERAADLRDLEAQVLRVLAGEAPGDARTLPEHAILFADEVLPSQLSALDASRIAGIVMARGGPTSHAALLAAARGIPTLVATGTGALAVGDGHVVVIDTASRRVAIDPPAAEVAVLRERIARHAARTAADLATCTQGATTRDGTVITVHANIGAVAEIAPALRRGAEGCGLLRTEFLFLDRRDAPGEDEQYECYAAAVRAFGGRPLTLRTLDVGGDKPLAYLPMPREDNPALGVRGVRAGLRSPALLHAQLRAILRAGVHGPVRVMLPMVNDLAELRAVRAMLHDGARELGVEVPALGVMIETPAAVLLADQLAREADFLSIGSNDLSQYVLAIDRGHAELAAGLDGLHPAVLRAIAQVAAAGRAAGRSVSVCGGLGSEIEALPLLVGLGIREVSAVPGAIPALKRALRELDVAACEALASAALQCESAAAVRDLVRDATTRGASTRESAARGLPATGTARADAEPETHR